MPLLRKDGSAVWVRYSGTPILEGGMFIGALALLTDITRQRTDDAVIHRQAEELQRIDRQKDQFLAMLGHELRNPLTPIFSALSLMKAKDDGTFRRERDVITRQAEQLHRIVDDLLNVSQFLTGTIPIKQSRVSVEAWVAAAVETVTPQFQEKGVALDVDAPESATVIGDQARLTQALVNLLTNGARYTPPGGRVSVQVAVDGTALLVRVKDDGMGISAEFLPHIFEPFTREKAAAVVQTSGLGLGLAMVHGIVSAHRGTVTAHSDGVGQGCEMVMQLPLAGAQVDSAQTTMRLTASTTD